MIALTNRADLIGAIGRARRVQLASWMLGRKSPVVVALEDAADRGADVHVTLERAPFVSDPARREKLQQLNLKTVRALQQHHVDARLSGEHDAPLHLKAAVIDGRAFLAQRNWAAGEMIVTSSDTGDVGAIASAIEAKPPHDTAGLALRKDRALELEAALIRDAPPGTAIECATESFGESPISDALLERARRGETKMRLALNGSALTSRFDRASAQTLEALRAAGVEVRRSKANEKVCVAGDQAWLGSANASRGEGGTLDWGLCTGNPAILAALHDRFEASWKEAMPLRALA